MNNLPLRRSTLLAMHPYPILCAGLAVALRQHGAFRPACDLVLESSQWPLRVADFARGLRQGTSSLGKRGHAVPKSDASQACARGAIE